MIEVRIAPALAAKDTALVHELAGLVNRVYAAAEGRTLGGSCGPARRPQRWSA
ncbi:MAG: hypothetical protein LBV34_28730 [Nocardiopsaceae bacterium]|jgi:hypothetical protein|nr:hypothetical protein [Nocardiopsaceae bacterium]